MTSEQLDELANQAKKYHHPHYTGVTHGRFGGLQFTFREFTGTEADPAMPDEVWSSTALSGAARALLETEYQYARTLHRDAKYTRDLKAAADGAAPLWTACTRARTAMDDAYDALSTTPDTHWRAAVSKLIFAQDRAAAAAQTWDAKAATIAAVHEAHVYSDLSRDAAYARAGLADVDWHVGYQSDYEGYGTSPVVRRTAVTIAEQRAHLKTIASLTGDHRAT
ncbi:hypothetical protein [Streptomyces sp. NPDC056987]|uniref:hypothetical protein n=1 Tax=Streptomyces sp. NPDC056987 TaxID=3345988 RepID=UPI003642EF4B